jgi:hypothetical protein
MFPDRGCMPRRTAAELCAAGWRDSRGTGRESVRVGLADRGDGQTSVHNRAQASTIRVVEAAFARMLFLEAWRRQSNFQPIWIVDMQ